MTAERRRALERRQVASTRDERGRPVTPAPSRSGPWAIVAIIGIALSFIAATHAMSPFSFAVASSLIDVLMPRTP